MKPFTLITGLAILLLATHCQLRSNQDREASSDVHTLTETLPRNGAERVTTRLSIGAGKLLVTGGADQLMEADFEYSQESWKPEISFEQQDSEGTLSVKQSGLTDNLNFNLGDNQRNEWRIRLNDEVPQNLECSIGAGETELDLRGLSLDRVDIDAGVGQHDINLTDTSLPELTVDAGVGEVNIDLSGTWNNNLRAEIDGGIGELNLKVPSDVGVQLDVSGGLGSVDVPPGYTKEGGTYTNAAYEQAEYRLDIDVDAGMGSIEVEEVEIMRDWLKYGSRFGE